MCIGPQKLDGINPLVKDPPFANSTTFCSLILVLDLKYISSNEYLVRVVSVKAWECLTDFVVRLEAYFDLK